MRKIAAGLIVLIACAPLTTSATTDDLIAQLYAALNGKVTSSPLGSASTTAVVATSTAVPASSNPSSQSAAVPAQSTDQILLPSHLFNVEGNAPKSDPQIEAMKSLLSSLIAQYALLSSQSTQSTTSAAVTATTPVPEPAPKKVFLRDLTVGSRGEDVTQLQKLLIARGFLFGDVTGYFGILTKTAVLAFQTDQGLPSVGNVGPRTRALLNTIPLDELIALKPPQSFAPPAVPFISSSTSVTMNASSTAGTSTPEFDAWAPAVSVSMSILPSEAPVGGSVAITWLSQNADTCVASDGWDGSKPTIGAARIEPLQFSLNLTLTCTGAGGVASTSALVVVGKEQ